MNANDSLSEYTGTEHYYRYFGDLVLTDGAKALADQFECYWFLDIIASFYPQLRKEEFQVWKLTRKDQETQAVVSCTDGNKKVWVEQKIPFTDFKPNEATLWLEFNVILLPSEH
jgi:uncharacterized repeat protein (TIGR04076 family)